MFKKLLKVRYILLVAVVFTLINAIVFLIIGVYESIQGYITFFKHGTDESHRPGLYILQGLDLFLVSMVFMIFALGIMRLFTHHDQDDSDIPAWLKIDNFKELKVLLWETILVTMVVFTFTEIVTNRNTLTWEALIMPGIIFLLTLSLAFMKREEKH